MLRTIIAIAAVLLGGYGLAPAQPAKPPEAVSAERERVAQCPVTGAPISYDHRVRFRGRRVYFASADAAARFEADPYAYREGLTRQWADLRPLQTQVRCPVTGKPVRMDVFVEQRTKDVYFADEAARQVWLGSPENYADRLEHCYTFQATCAVCENAPLAEVSEEVNGRAIYFCCPGCRGALDTDRAGFLRDVDREIRANRAAWSARGEPATTRPAEPMPRP